MKILLIEDDRTLSYSLCEYLSRERFEVVPIFSYSESLSTNVNKFDLAIIDWDLGDGHGLDLLKMWTRNDIKKPMLFLTAKADLIDKVLTLESGACDYITKPFEPRELLARIRVHLRIQKTETQLLTVNQIRVQIRNRSVYFKDQLIDLSKTEFELLYFLIRHPEEVFTREDLLKEVWGYHKSPTTRTVDTHILQLRQKLSSNYFETLHGIGYRFKIIP